MFDNTGRPRYTKTLISFNGDGWVWGQIRRGQMGMGTNAHPHADVYRTLVYLSDCVAG